MPIPTLNTQRLALRPFRRDDLERLAEILSDPDVMRYLPGGQPRSREQTQNILENLIQHWQKHEFGVWALDLKPEGRLIGWCGFKYVPETDEVELIYTLEKPCWGQGLAAEAAAACLEHAFGFIGLPAVLAVAVPENTGSRRVMEKLGMRFEGISGLYYNAQLAVYTISMDDWRKKK